MKVTGIIAEYNPFHNGHLYHIQTAKQQTNADYVVIVMSGDYTQRGIPALLSKYVRAKHALLAGADLVLELPTPYAISSAEHFALGSCALLNQLGVVDNLCFGMEQDDLTSLQSLADIISSEPAEYQNLIKEKLSEGLSFPKAQLETLKIYKPGLNLSLLDKSNNRLGLEYLKALRTLNSSITPVPIKRIGKDYDDTGLSSNGNQEFSSASAIRNHVSDNINIQELNHHVPAFVWEDMETLLNNKEYLFTRDFDLLLHYKLLQQSSETLQEYVDINEDIANKIINHLPSYEGFDDFCMKLKSKDLTYTRISRMLLHVILDFKKTDLQLLSTIQHTPYGRILGFRKESGALLHEIKEKSSFPLISKLADASKLLSKDALYILEKDISSAHIYGAVLSQKSGCVSQNEYKQPIVIV